MLAFTKRNSLIHRISKHPKRSILKIHQSHHSKYLKHKQTTLIQPTKRDLNKGCHTPVAWEEAIRVPIALKSKIVRTRINDVSPIKSTKLDKKQRWYYRTVIIKQASTFKYP